MSETETDSSKSKKSISRQKTTPFSKPSSIKKPNQRALSRSPEKSKTLSNITTTPIPTGEVPITPLETPELQNKFSAILLSAPEKQHLQEIEKEEKLKKYYEEKCTRLVFSFSDGQVNEKLIESKFNSYFDLQREIAMLTPRSLQLFSVLYPDKTFVRNSSFRTSPVYHIREFSNSKITSLAPSALRKKIHPSLRLPTQWDFLKYHAAPPNWEDPVVVRERIRQEQEERKKKKEEEKRRNRDEFDFDPTLSDDEEEGGK